MTSHAPAMMRALQLSAYDGDSASIQLVEKPVPILTDGQVVVRIAAAPVNPSDLMFLRGIYGIKKPLPVVPGFEGSGVVVAGTGIIGKALIGQRVACAAPDNGDGTWAEYMCTAAERCFPLTKSINFETGATFIVNPLTAWALVDIARKAQHQAVIQTAAASQLGQMIVRLGQRFKLPVINIVRRAEQVELLRALGAEYVLNSNLPAFDADLRSVATTLGATLAFEAIAGEMTGRVLTAMPNDSQVLVYGALSEAACQIDPGAFIFERKRVAGFWLSDWMAQRNLIKTVGLGAEIQRLLHTDLASTIQACLPLEAAAQGLQQYQNQMTGGKILFIPNGEVVAPEHTPD